MSSRRIKDPMSAPAFWTIVFLIVIVVLLSQMR
jgi:hypothetical protein